MEKYVDGVCSTCGETIGYLTLIDGRFFLLIICNVCGKHENFDIEEWKGELGGNVLSTPFIHKCSEEVQ